MRSCVIEWGCRTDEITRWVYTFFADQTRSDSPHANIENVSWSLLSRCGLVDVAEPGTTAACWPLPADPLDVDGFIASIMFTLEPGADIGLD